MAKSEVANSTFSIFLLLNMLHTSEILKFLFGLLKTQKMDRCYFKNMYLVFILVVLVIENLIWLILLPSAWDQLVLTRFRVNAAIFLSASSASVSSLLTRGSPAARAKQNIFLEFIWNRTIFAGWKSIHFWI